MTAASLPSPGTHSPGIIRTRLLLLPALPRRAFWYSMAFLEGCLCLPLVTSPLYPAGRQPVIRELVKHSQTKP
jgi:hypothetical protein